MLHITNIRDYNQGKKVFALKLSLASLFYLGKFSGRFTNNIVIST